MANEFKAHYSHLLLARSIPDPNGEKLPIECEFRFDVLEAAIRHLTGNLDTPFKDLLQLAADRVNDMALRLSYPQIVGAARPWRDPAGTGAPGSTWHDCLPVGLLVLVAKDWETVREVEAQEPNELEGQWDRFNTLLTTITTAINDPKSNDPWGSSLWTSLLVASFATADARADRVHAWATIEFSDTQTGIWLLPAYRADGKPQPEATLQVPTALDDLMPDAGATAAVVLADPRTLIPLRKPRSIEFSKGKTQSVTVDLPELELDELSRAAQLLRSYRVQLDGEATEWGKRSLWDAALELDPPQDGGLPNEAKWRENREQLNRRLESLVRRGTAGFTNDDLEVLVSAVWARRLTSMAAKGLAYAAGAAEKSIGKVKDVKSLPYSDLPSATDSESDARPAAVRVEIEPTLCAFYLVVRMGGAASSASARSLNITAATIGSGVPGLLIRPEQVYVEVSSKIRQHLRDDGLGQRAQGAIEWLRDSRASNFRAGRSLTGLDVFSLIRGVQTHKLVTKDDSVEIADINVGAATGSQQLENESTLVSLVKALHKVFQRPPAGGLPTFVSELVNNGLDAGGQEATAAPMAQAPSTDAVRPAIPDGLMRLFSRGFEDTEGLLCHLTARAAERQENLRGARDIVLMGRGRFIAWYGGGSYTPEVLSRVYSRAWSKTNARAQFIAATRSSVVPDQEGFRGGVAEKNASGDGRTECPPGAQHDPGLPQQVKSFPDLAHLFGLTDLPTCTWGDSVHGPAAYLADMLEFLRHRRLVSSEPKSSKTISALALLLKRRPDLPEIDLSDKNATVKMPFIDLVNELLESQVVGADAFKLDLKLTNWKPEAGKPIDRKTLASFQKSLDALGVSLLEPVVGSHVPERLTEQGCRREAWMVRDRTGIAVKVWRHHSADSWQARLVPQATLTATELEAEPQYGERRAYDELSTTTVPGGALLPWSLGEAQLQEWLNLVSVKPGQILSGSRPESQFGSDDDWLPWSVFHLGLSQAEGAGLIFCGTVQDKLLWGEDESSLTLAKLLQRADISFDEVRSLEQTHEVGRKKGLSLIPVESDPYSADSTKIKVEWKSGDGASTTAKFLRLRRRLGWSIEDLDLALNSANIGRGKLDAVFARRLSQLMQLSERLSLGTGDTLRVFTRLRTTALGRATSSVWASVFLDSRVNGADQFRDAAALQVLKTLALPGNGEKTIEGELRALDSVVRRIPESKLRTMIAAVLRLSAEDTDVLVKTRHGLGATWLQLNREKLSQLYGASVLLRALQVEPRAMQAMVNLTAISPFDSPGGALELVSFKEELGASGLSPQALSTCLLPPDGVEAPMGQALAWYSPKVVMSTVLAMHKALQEVEAVEAAVLLRSGSTDLKTAPKAWRAYLDATGTGISSESTWAERLNLLGHSIRRMLPRIKIDAARLRSKGVNSYVLVERTGCVEHGRLLADDLESIEGRLDTPLPEGIAPSFDGSQPVGEAASASASEGSPTVEPGVDLLHPDVARWVVEVFAPVLQWVGLPKQEVQSRLAPWLSLLREAQRTRQAQPGGAVLPAEPAEAALLASYLMCQPLERHAFRADRQTTLSAALSQALETSEAHAWALLTAVPALEQGFSDAAEWWLQRDVEQVADSWRGPVDRSLQQQSEDESLHTAFGQIKVLSLFWRAVGGLKLDTATIAWLYEAPTVARTWLRSDRLQTLSPKDLVAASSPKDGNDQVRNLAGLWRRLAAWAKVFRESADVKAVDGLGKPLSLREDVLDLVLRQPDVALMNQEIWLDLGGALERLLGLASIQATAQLGGPGRAKSLLTPETYAWLKSVDALHARTGLSAEEVTQIAGALSGRNEEEQLRLCARLRASLRKRFTDSGWLEASRKGQDGLREQKRDALVAYLLSRRDTPWHDKRHEPSPDRLYEHLLLDTQPAACMTTSRIVQAQAGIQQFALRCTMGLEEGWQIPANELVDWDQWKWMRTYRVWEACRKIFLYPENWMEPEVRDDKSRFFEELESDLNQGELTNENAEMAFVRYLHKLHDVARLDVVATYYEFDPNEPVMHILGRTPSQPFRYFYRQWVDERRWTPWEPVDLEIDTQHIVLFKRGGRLHLGWMTAIHEETKPKLPTHFETVKQGESTYKVTGIEEPKVQWKLQLTTSQRAREGWQAKRTSPGHLTWPPEPVAMSDLAKNQRVEFLQLGFQDFGAPEILVTAVPPGDGLSQDQRSAAMRKVVGSFSLASCLGVAHPEQVGGPVFLAYPIVPGTTPDGSRLVELASNSTYDEELTVLEGSGAGDVVSAYPSLMEDRRPGIDPTPGRFAVTLATQASMLDAAVATARAALVPPPATRGAFTMGLGLPFFYSDDAVDIVVRTNFSPPVREGDQPGLKRSPINARHIARTMGALREAILSEGVQTKFWQSRDPAANAEGEWARGVIRAIEKAAPTITSKTLVDLLQTVAAPYPSNSPFELAARTHHPLACELVNRAEGRGIASVFSGRVQELLREDVYRGRTRTGLSNAAIERFGHYALSYEEDRDAYAIYNWEMFYHAPYLLAMKFCSEGKFEDSLRWFQYIFDPIGVDDGGAAENNHARQFWKPRPFRSDMLDSYQGHGVDALLDPGKWKSGEVPASALQDLADSIMAWRRKPNLPFQVARGRWVAFQKAVLYRYIETLIAWADARFRMDTREEITAASQLYVLAGRLLGRRPRTDISMCDRGQGSGAGSQSYEQLQELIDRRDDELSKYLDTLFGEVDNILDCAENEEPDSPHLNFYNEYFCIPPNEKLFDLWDRVADRLYKVRNCLNIDGVFRSLSLFAPPIDPALLARAGAAGLSFDQIMAGLNQPRSHYRFSVMLQKANEVAAELRTLGSELLQALEKRDAEELALLRSRLDLQAIRLNKDIRDEQIEEAKSQLEAIAAQITNVKARKTRYLEWIAKGTSAKERESIDGIRSGLMVRTRVAAMKSTAALASLIPTFTIGANGAFGTPHFALRISGQDFAFAQNYFADKLAIEGDKDQTAAGITATLASYERRMEDWQLQRDMAAGEMASLDRQLIAAEIRLSIALAEKRNLERSIESAEVTDTFLKSKFTNAGLYDWMVRQVSAVYYKTYQLASDYARSAEDCLNRELPLSESGVKVVRSDHWNGLRKGLLAATGLIHDLKRLESEHIKRNKRIPELTKHVSLAVVDPAQLIQLRATGSCGFKIPEVLFEMDHPGHVARRIKSVALSVPCVVGPYTGVACKLSLVSSAIRRRAEDKGPEKVMSPAAAVFTSSSNNDSGLWELNLRDERYLPFEDAGAVDSEWRLELPAVVRQFDYATISDVVLHIRYTSEPGGNRSVAEKELVDKLSDAKSASGPLWAYTSLRNDLAEQFSRLAQDQQERKIRLKLPTELARWMGQSIAPTGQVRVAVLGDGSGAVTVRFMDTEYPCVAVGSEYRAWIASIDLSNKPASLLDQAGFDFEIRGVSQLRDVVFYIAGVLAK